MTWRSSCLLLALICRRYYLYQSIHPSIHRSIITTCRNVVVTLSALLIGHLTLMVTCGYVIPPVHETDPPQWGPAWRPRRTDTRFSFAQFKSSKLRTSPLTRWQTGVVARAPVPAGRRRAARHACEPGRRRRRKSCGSDRAGPAGRRRGACQIPQAKVSWLWSVLSQSGSS